MKKYFVLTLFLCSCTPSTQPAARMSMEMAIKQENTIIVDLANIGKQYALNDASSKVNVAVSTGDQAAATKAIEELATRFDKINWLQIQHERANRLFDLVRSFIVSREGIFDIVVKEYKEAKEAAENKK